MVGKSPYFSAHAHWHINKISHSGNVNVHVVVQLHLVVRSIRRRLDLDAAVEGNHLKTEHICEGFLAMFQLPHFYEYFSWQIVPHRLEAALTP